MYIDSISIILMHSGGSPEQLWETMRCLTEQRDIAGCRCDLLLIDGTGDVKIREMEFIGPGRKKALPVQIAHSSGIAASLNLAVTKTAGNMIVFSDSAVQPDRRWLSGFRQCFRDSDCDAAGGRVLPLYPPKVPLWMTKFRYILSDPFAIYDYGRENEPYEPWRMSPFTGLNLAVKRRSLERFGRAAATVHGRELLTNDRQLCECFARQGARLFYCGQALVYHRIERRMMTYRYLARWFIDYGRSAARDSCPEKGIYYFGLPRWKLKHLFKGLVLLLLNVFSRRNFLENGRQVFSKIGEILEYRSFRNGERQRHTTGS